MLVVCQLAGLSALEATMPSAARARNPADGVAVLPDWGATLGPLWVPILAGSPLEAPGRPQGPLSRPPKGGARLTGRLKGLAGRSTSTNGATSISADAFAGGPLVGPWPARLERVLTRSLGQSIPSLGDGVMLGTAWIDRPVDTQDLHSLLPRPP